MIKIKRVYEPYSKGDGYRALVDRLWPRGVKKTELKIDEWCKEIAPSTELRKWFNHDPERWAEFRTRYLKELKEPAAQEELQALAVVARTSDLTLLYAAHDEEHNNAKVIQSRLERMAD